MHGLGCCVHGGVHDLGGHGGVHDLGGCGVHDLGGCGVHDLVVVVYMVVYMT